MEDNEIMAELAARNESALLALDAQYGRLCLSIARNILGSNEDAEECVNDVWLKIWDSIPPASPPSLRSYAAMITRRLSLNRHESRIAACRDVRITTPFDELAELLPDTNPLTDRLELAELGAAINAYLGTLDSETRCIFIRRYWHCDAIADIAAQLGLQEGTVRVRLHRTRQKLRQTLERRNLL